MSGVTDDPDDGGAGTPEGESRGSDASAHGSGEGGRAGVLPEVEPRRLAELREVARDLTRATNRTEVCDVATRAVVDVFDLSPASVVRIADDPWRLATVATSEDGAVGRGGRRFVDAPTIGEAAWRAHRTGAPVVVDDPLPDGPFGAVAVVPVGEFGVLACAASAQEGIADRTVELLGILAANTDAALDRAHREEALREVRAELERSNAELEQFAYAASHDLREPLRMVTSYLELLERRHGDQFDDDAQELVDVAVEGAERMKEMVAGLLEYSRVDSRGRDPEPTDLDRALAQARENLAIAIEESGASVTSDDLPTVVGDHHQLVQLFQNLVSNAIQYAGEDPPRVHVSAVERGDRWEVAVEDDGVGIDPDRADRAFDVFERLGAPDGSDGTGMGLAICQKIVDRHGGEIRIDSTPGEGTTVRFTLPATDAGDL